MKQSSIEKLHAEGSDLISKHLNGAISARDLIVMYHNLYYDNEEMHKQEIKNAFRNGIIEHDGDCSSEQYYNKTFKSE